MTQPTECKCRNYNSNDPKALLWACGTVLCEFFKGFGTFEKANGCDLEKRKEKEEK